MLMKKIIILLLTGLFLGSCAPNARSQHQTVKLNKSNPEQVLEAMTLKEKVNLLTGEGLFGSSIGAAGATKKLSRLGIPSLELADGPAGLRLRSTATTWYPSASLLASTWDTSLVTAVGKAMGAEALAHGADVILGPAMNIHRHPLCGRNYEYYSEDPLLTGIMASAMVRGIQENGTAACLKHYAANNQETNRDNNNVIADQRTLHEIYFRGFEIAVRESFPKTIMSSYNRINGTYTSEDSLLLTGILRDQWGFKGLVMSDWFGGRNAPAQILAGNDLLEPGRGWQRRAILKAVRKGTLPEEAVNISVRRVLGLVLDSHAYRNQMDDNNPAGAENADNDGKIADGKTAAANRHIARKAAAEGMVLLENRNALPFNDSISRIALFGVSSYRMVAGGVGSGEVYTDQVISPAEGLQEAGYIPDAQLTEHYQSYIDSVDRAYKRKWKSISQRIMGQALPAETDPGTEVIALAAVENQAAIVAIGRRTGEFSDRKIEGDYLLTQEEKELIGNVCKAFQVLEKPVIVVLNVGGIVETASWSGLPDALLLAWMPGQEGGRALANIISGKENPCGRLPVTIPVHLEDLASHKNFPQEEVPVKWLSMMGKKQKKTTADRPNIDYTIYEEGIYVGYRDFDSHRKEVAYPFGYGLSYTSFRYSPPVVRMESDRIIVQCRISNDGARAGREVVQVYACAPEGMADKPYQELKGFAKTPRIGPQESCEIQIIIPIDRLSSYVPATGWVVDPGKYTLRIGSSSRNIQQEIRLPGIPGLILPPDGRLP
ncbi:MAG: Thermostable beta-glucosidase B [Bacteroidetes bacterium ADurb.Bin139]|nr:MAG: Thermostable beta-glucosidase B [Bacteroidetes bacterium ADurb.Bin139]